MIQALIFDFDGVLADSEVVANTVLAEIVTGLGVPTTLDDSLQTYMGKRLHEVMDAISATIGRELPEGFEEKFQSATFQRFSRDLQLVEGVLDYIEAFSHLPRCIASSSSPDRLQFCIEHLNLKDLFGEHVYSASKVTKNKPHPDIFLHASSQLGVDPEKCIVIEDSINGTRAGVAAGATVIGLLAAGHIREGHELKLKEAGAHYVAKTFEEAKQITQKLASNSK